MFKKESLLLALATLAGLLTTAGCYTLVRHPVADVSDFRDDVLTDPSHETGACFTCHESGGGYSPIVGIPPTWGPWYPPPWWTEPNPPSGPGSPASGPDDQVRHGWDRGPGAPRTGPGTEPGTAPGVTPTPADPNGTPAAPVDPVRAEPDRVKNDDKDKDKQKDKDKDRRGWGR